MTKLGAAQPTANSELPGTVAVADRSRLPLSWLGGREQSASWRRKKSLSREDSCRQSGGGDGAGGPSSLQGSLHPSPKQEPKAAMFALDSTPLVIFDGTMAGHLTTVEPIRISVPGIGPGKMARSEE